MNEALYRIANIKEIFKKDFFLVNKTIFSRDNSSLSLLWSFLRVDDPVSEVDSVSVGRVYVLRAPAGTSQCNSW